MNGYDYKREINRIFKVARSMYPEVTDDMLYENGKIFYMNANDGTDFDWNVNDRLCEFMIYHKNEMGFIKAFVNKDNSIEMIIYKNDTDMLPTYKFKEDMENLRSRDFANLMNHIADKNRLYDVPIDTLDWDIDTMYCYDISNENGEDEEE